jgi:hypothetical protein
MAEFQLRSDAVDVEHIMQQIRQRIREKRGVDYSEEELRALANVKLEKIIDPKGLRSDLVQQFQATHPAPEPLPNYSFENTTLYETHRGVIRFIRRLLNPLLKLFFNPNPIVDALNIQARLNAHHAQFEHRQLALDALRFEVIHNLVLELTRASVEVRNLRMRLDAMAGRLDFDERRQRAFEGVVEYRKPGGRGGSKPEGSSGSPGSQGSVQGSGGSSGSAGSGSSGSEGDEGQRARRRRRRRRRVPSAGMPNGAGSDGGGQPGGPAEGGEAPSE